MPAELPFIGVSRHTLKPVAHLRITPAVIFLEKKEKNLISFSPNPLFFHMATSFLNSLAIKEYKSIVHSMFPNS